MLVACIIWENYLREQQLCALLWSTLGCILSEPHVVSFDLILTSNVWVLRYNSWRKRLFCVNFETTVEVLALCRKQLKLGNTFFSFRKWFTAVLTHLCKVSCFQRKSRFVEIIIFNLIVESLCSCSTWLVGDSCWHVKVFSFIRYVSRMLK